MPRKKLDVLEPPVEPPKEEPERQQPVASWRYPTTKDNQVEVSIWENTAINGSGEQFTFFSITNQHHWCDKDGLWHTNGYYKFGDLPALLHGTNKAYAWILDQKDLNITQPF